MRPYFITCSVPDLKHQRYGRENDPVNLSQVVSFRKGQLKYYPDNDGIPCLRFFVGHDEEISWAYLDVKQRDEDYDKILGAFGTNLHNVRWVTNADLRE